MKRKLSLIMATVMVAGCFTGFAVKAETLPANIADYTPGTKNTNIVPDASSGGGSTWLSNRNNGGIDASDYYTADNALGGNKYSVKWSYTNANGDPLALVMSTRNLFDGIELNSTQKTYGFTPEANKKYVFSANLKNASPEGAAAPYVGVSMVDGNWNIYTLNTYGTQGMQLTSEWKKLEGVISLPETYISGTKSYTDPVFFGFPAGTAAGSAFWLDVSQKDAVYIAEEQAYDITNTKAAGLDELCVGGTETLKAEVVNQIGLPGYCSQNFTWYALDTARTATVSGITVTPSSDTKTATVSVDSTVPAGQYDIVAYSSDYSMAKGYRITVVDAVNYQDYTPGTKNANLVPDASSGGGSTWLSCRNNSSIDASDYYTVDNALGGNKYSVKWSYINASGDPLALAWAARNLFDGIELNSTQKTYDFTPAANKKYVFSANLKNASPEGIAAPYIGVSMVDGNWNMYTLNTYGTQGMQLTSEWKKLEGVISLPETYISGTKAYTDPMFFGFAAGTAAGSAFWLDVSQKDAVYIAEEQAYDITNTKTAGNDTLTSGGSASFGAEIQNQIGLPGYCEQNFQWYAMNTARNAEISGITVTPSSDTKTATVSVDSSVPAGQYDIVAYSNKYSMAKGYRITVTESVTPQLTQENGTASFTANVTNAESSTALSFILVKYDTNGKTTGVVSDHVTVANGVATSTALNLSSLASGTKVKAFVWDANMKPLAAAQTITIN